MMLQSSVQTPHFVIDVEKVNAQTEEIQKSLQRYWPDGLVGYSFKTNNLPWLISYLKRKGVWAEVVSSDEYCLAKDLGYQASEIIFNGPVKGRKEFIEAVENGAIVNLDSKRELDWLLACNKDKLAHSHIGLRVNFCLEKYCPGETQCGAEDGRFGFSYETGELLNAIRFLQQNEIPLAGLHLHCSSKTRSLNIYRAIAQTAVKIVAEYELDLEYVDVGGGYFGGMPNKPSFDDYFSLIHHIFAEQKRLDGVKVIVEPGMAIVGAAVEYVTSVVDVKRTLNNTFVLLDGSRIHVDPLMTKTQYAYRIEKATENPMTPPIRQTLCGFTCMESDRFFDLDAEQLETGDRVVFEKVGAYTVGMCPQFIEFYPAVYACENNCLTLARPQFTSKDFVK